ncbi:S49 family peptidase [uncultured Pseudacidovorax sp.]|uniref:S49 family peptidase n=1 Tax=uncultured Pseudacidovorax sp. TaxID=679313 RepID=UPI0025EECEBE|nr:S49 family peptidase [uncultured Pseudacidovorax sp.]
MSHLAHIASRMFNVPVAIHPRKAEIIVAALAERLGVARVARMMEDDVWEDSPKAMTGEGRNPRAGYDVAQGVALIPVAGTLVHKLGTVRPYSGMTGYDGIRQNVLTALADPEVKGIMLDVDSPGGEVAGCFDLVDTIYKARQIKPVWAMVDEMAYSAGYALASAAERVVTPRTGGVGSVGVVVMHMDMSDALAKSGLKVTIISYGDHKADGNPYERLPADVRERIQADIDSMGRLFVSTVARNRSVSEDSIRATQARCFLGPEGQQKGLADAVMAPDEAFLEFVESLT